MARKAMIAKNLKRMEQVEQYAAKRKELIKAMHNPESTEEERMAARKKFESLPRDASRTRVKMRCEVTGRSKGNYRRFRMCRVAFRQMALQGLLPGVTKSSW